jgi:TolB-like protein
MSGIANEPNISVALEALLTSRTFARSSRLRMLLKYVVDAQMSKRGGWIRESAVALDVFHRDPATFDSAHDGIVRVSFNRLRELLTKYYEDEGKDEPLRFEIPRGGYAVLARRRVPAGLSSSVRIAVLPLTNLTNDKNYDVLCDGLTEDLIDALARVPQLQVLARTSTLRYRNTQLDMRDIANELNAETLIEGSVQRVGEQLRITAQLILGSDGTHLWSQAFEADTEDRAALQGALLDIVARSLEAHSARSQQVVEALESNRGSAVVRDLLDQSRSALEMYSAEGVTRAEALARQATQLAPDYAPAWAALAGAFLQQRLNNNIGFSASLYELRKAYARALACDPQSPAGLGIRGYDLIVHEMMWQSGLDDAASSYTIAPNNAWVIFRYGTLSLWATQYEQSREMFDRLLVLNPNFPPAYYMRSLAAICLGNEKEAFDWIGEGKNRVGKLPFFDDGEVRHLLLLGRPKDALTKAKRAAIEHGAIRPFTYVTAICHAALGNRAEADRMLVDQHSALNPLHQDIALANVAYYGDDFDQFYRLANRALDNKCPTAALLGMGYGDEAKRVGSDSRWHALMRRMNRSTQPPYTPVDLLPPSSP